MRREISRVALLLLWLWLGGGCATAGALPDGDAESFIGPGAKGYVGSEKCRPCHAAIHAQWRRTPHARMLRDATKERSAVAAVDFSRVPFGREDILWTIGSRREQKYLTYTDDDWYVLPNWWNLRRDEWEPYRTFNWLEKPYTIWCAGCHTTGFDPATRTAFEPGVGCEACHGPGERHVAGLGRAGIVNPDRLAKARRDMVCEQCHTGGKDTRSFGRFPFPAGFRPGEDLGDYYAKFFAPKPGANRWYWGTMDYRERHRAFLFDQERFHSIFIPGGPTWPRYKDITPDEHCGDCHRKIFKAGRAHTRHEPAQAACTDCHIPTTAKDGLRYSIHDHRFDYSGPEPACDECHDLADNADRYHRNPEHRHKFRFDRVKTAGPLTIAQACARCHPGKNVEETLATWKNRSPL
jgi:hypothetical protein